MGIGSEKIRFRFKNIIMYNSSAKSTKKKFQKQKKSGKKKCVCQNDLIATIRMTV